MKINEQLNYEKNLSFSSITSWLHSFRYKHIDQIISDFADESKKPIKILEIGCGGANLFMTLNKFDIIYTGIELNSDFCDVAIKRHGHNSNFSIINQDAAKAIQSIDRPDIVIALETFEHIPEHDVVRIIEKVTSLQPSLFVCSVPVELGPSIWLKNVGSFLLGYSRYKEYSWLETFWSGFYQLDKVTTHTTGHKGFDWRWLAQTIRHNMKILETRRFPFTILPVCV